MNNGVIPINETEKTELALFKPRSWLLKIDFINHLVLFNNLLITVLAETAGGKSSFGKLLQHNLDKKITSVVVAAKATKQQMMHEIVSQLHLKNETNNTISSIATQVNDRKAHVLLIIDDAHLLPNYLLKEALLALKEQGTFGFFHICLLSDHSVVPTLNQLVSETLTHLVHTIELGSLSETETRTYVLQRALLNNLIKTPLSEQQFNRLYQLTKGNLAIINSQLETFILDNPLKRKKFKLNNKQVVAPLGVAFLIAGLYIGVSGFLHFEKGKKPVVTPSLEVAQVESSASYIASWQDASTHEVAYPALAKMQSVDGTAIETPNETIAKIPAIYAKNRNQDLAHQPKSESQLVKIGGLSHPTALQSSAENQVIKQYTIQLVASPHQVDIYKFRQRNELFKQTKVRRYSNGGADWYVLTLGEFTSRTIAQEKASHLPVALARFNPWVRPVSGLKQVG